MIYLRVLIMNSCGPTLFQKILGKPCIIIILFWLVLSHLLNYCSINKIFLYMKTIIFNGPFLFSHKAIKINETLLHISTLPFFNYKIYRDISIKLEDCWVSINKILKLFYSRKAILPYREVYPSIKLQFSG